MCGCQMRTSYGLPCAHEQTMYLRNGNQLPLDSVHIFWKKFDLHPYICLEDDDVDIDVEVQTSNTRSQKQSRSSKFSWFQKTKDIFSSSTTSLREPTSQKNKAPIGRPRLSTQRPRIPPTQDPQTQYLRRHSFATSMPDYTGSNQFDLNQEPMSDSSFSFREPPTFYSNLLMNEIPNIFHPYVTNIENVEEDGNCGFRAVAVSLGYNQNYWPQIRSQLRTELTTYWRQYETVFGSSTCFPLWIGPQDISHHQSIAIALVHNVYYVKVDLQELHPMPEICPLWRDYRSECTAGWEIMYNARLNAYRSQNGNDNYTNTTSQDHDTENTYFVSNTSEFETSMVFNSRQQLIDWVQNTGRNNGYVLVTKRSTANYSIYFQCDCGGNERRYCCQDPNQGYCTFRSEFIKCDWKLTYFTESLSTRPGRTKASTPRIENIETPNVHTIPRNQGQQNNETEEREMEEFQAFKKYQALSRKTEEKGKQKENMEADWENVSLHTCHADDSDDDNGVTNKEEPQKPEGKKDKGTAVTTGKNPYINFR
ncbi:hypothetical protein LXL04_006184 [Taraxacum kok-saghyz]